MSTEETKEEAGSHQSESEEEEPSTASRIDRHKRIIQKRQKSYMVDIQKIS
jgi:hypothetical protein